MSHMEPPALTLDDTYTTESPEFIAFADRPQILTSELRDALVEWIVDEWGRGRLYPTNEFDVPWMKLLLKAVASVPVGRRVPQPARAVVVEQLESGVVHPDTMRPLIQHSFPVWYTLLEMELARCDEEKLRAQGTDR